MSVKYLLLEESIDCEGYISEKEFKDRLIEFLSICEEIIQYDDEDIFFSENLYGEFVRGTEFANWLYSDEESLNDEKKLLRLLMEQSFINDEQIYQEYRSQINEKYKDYNLAALNIFSDLKDLVETEFSIYNMEDCFRIRRLFLNRVRDRIIFFNSITKAFPNLCLGENVENSLRHFNPIGDHIEELIRHLAALNDEIISIFEDYSREGEVKVLSIWSSKTGIICSPEGNPQVVETYLKFNFKGNEGNTYKVSCSPHTKLYRANSNFRIYFTWNNKRFTELPPILIGHIGGHPYP
ncbi:hypothetical protein AB0Y38_18690 [Lysinibacillus capsici]|uniref:hypothetical protein n=1 Tax=Lysinibacillus capsici TaxID=2115968 RepID=UPI003F2306EF